MESKKSRDLSEIRSINDWDSGIIRGFRNPKEYPLYFLFLVFLFYALVDVVATLILFGQIDNWSVAGVNFLIGYLMIATFFNIVLPEYYIHKRKVVGVIYLLILMGLVLLLKILAFKLLFGNEFAISKPFLINEFMRIFHFLIITSAIWTLYENFRLKERKLEIKKEHEQLLVMHRSMQLSSHFVLNSLSVYLARILKFSPVLASQFTFLASLLRYSFKKVELPNNLKEEINAVRSYLEIQKMRFSQLSMDLEIDVGSKAETFSMPKLCLLTLVENVFFHGIYTDSKNPCKIHFHLMLDDLTGKWVFHLNIANKIRGSALKVSSGFGASSVFKVLQFRFQDNFEYEVDTDENDYSLFLRIRYESEV